MPRIRAGLKCGHRCDVRFWRAIFQVVIEKGAQDVASKRQRRVAIELDGAERAALADLASEAIDSLTVGTANSDEKASRKRRLIKGPEEFREVRVDRRGKK